MTRLRHDPVVLAAAAALAATVLVHLPGVDGEVGADLRYVGALFVHIVLLASMLYRVSAVADREERRFWKTVAGGFAVWFFLDILPSNPEATPYRVAYYLLEDAGYMLMYFVLLIAIERRPHLGARGVSGETRWRYRVAGTTLIVGGLFLYFAVLPAILSTEHYTDVASCYYLYAIVDAYLVLRLLLIAAACESSRWRSLYAGMMLAWGIWCASDIVAGLGEAGHIQVNGPVYEAMYYAGFFAMMATIVVRDHARARDKVATRSGMRHPAGNVVGEMLSGALLFTVMHMASYLSGLLQEDTRSARAILVLLLSLAFIGLGLLRRRGQRREGLGGAMTFVVNDDEFAHAQRMESLGRLAGGVAHDFNNLLMAIRGYSELGAGSSMDPEAKELFEQVRSATDRGSALTAQLLAFSRKQHLEMKAVDVHGVISELRDLFSRLIGANIQLDVTLADADVRIHADPGQISQVLLNLVVNARDAMPAGGHIQIRTSVVDLEGSESGGRKGRHLHIEVADDGKGMDAETRAQAFEPFYTTRARLGGTGLGLATVYGIVTQSGGVIRVDSAAGAGTVFHLFFPVVVLACAPVAREGEAAPAPHGGGETILIAEDEGAVRDLTRRYLLARGYRVLEAGSGAEALRVANGHDDRIDLVLTDMIMPGMGGKQVVSQMRAARPETRFVYMSGYLDGDDGGDGIPYLQKPFALTELGMLVRRVLDEEPGPEARTP